MTVLNFSGRCAMRIRPWLGVVWLVFAGAASADDVPGLPVDPDAEAAYQLDGTNLEDWRLDPAIFTEISPVDVPEVAIRLPDDQTQAD